MLGTTKKLIPLLARSAGVGTESSLIALPNTLTITF